MPEVQFRKGDLVRFRLGIRSVQGQVKEDRGPIGVKGRHLYLVEFLSEPQAVSLSQIELPAVQESSAASPIGGTLQLSITLDVGGGCFRFEWRRAGSTESVGRGQLATTSLATFGFSDLQWSLETGGRTEQDGCSHWTSSVRALVNRLHRRFALADECITVQVLTDVAIGQAKAGAPHAVALAPDEPAWKWLAHQVLQFTRFLEVPELARGTDPAQRARSAAYILGCVWLRGAPNPEGLASRPDELGGS